MRILRIRGNRRGIQAYTDRGYQINPPDGQATHDLKSWVADDGPQRFPLRPSLSVKAHLTEH